MKRPPFAERHPLWFVALLELAVVMVGLCCLNWRHGRLRAGVA